MNSRDDADFWGLTNLERVHFHGRISDYYGRLTRMHAERSDRYGRIARRLAAIAISLSLVSLLLAALSALGAAR